MIVNLITMLVLNRSLITPASWNCKKKSYYRRSQTKHCVSVRFICCWTCMEKTHMHSTLRCKCFKVSRAQYNLVSLHFQACTSLRQLYCVMQVKNSQSAQTNFLVFKPTKVLKYIPNYSKSP